MFDQEVPIEFLLHMRGLDDDQPDLTKFSDDDFIQDPTAAFIEKAQFDRAMGKTSGADWDEEIGGAALHKASDDTDAGDLRKLWQSIVRTEKVQDRETGEWWAKGYDRNGVLVDARVLIGADAA